VPAAENIMLTNLGANARADLMVDGDYGESDRRIIQQNGFMTYAIVADAIGISLMIRSQARIISPLHVVEAGGTAGVFPDMQQKAIQVPVFAGEKIVFEVRETAGVATTDIMLTIETPG